MGKKIIAVASIALLTGTLMGCSNVTSKDMKNKDAYGYDEILSKIAASIENEEESENGEYSYMYPKFGNMGASDFGYAYIQINENEQALVVGENGTGEYPSILYDMYERKNGELVHVFSGGERDRYYATDTTGAFIEEGSSSAEDSFFDTFIVRDGARNSANFYREPEKINIVLEPFVNQNSGDKAIIEVGSSEINDTDSQTNNMKSSNKKHSIEVTDDKEIIKKCPKSAKSGDKVTIKAYSFMDVIPIIEINGDDIGEWDKNRIEYTFIMPDEDVRIVTRLRRDGSY